MALRDPSNERSTDIYLTVSPDTLKDQPLLTDNNKKPQVQIHSQWLRESGLNLGQDCLIIPYVGARSETAQQVWIRPASEEDWEILVRKYKFHAQDLILYFIPLAFL